MSAQLLVHISLTVIVVWSVICVVVALWMARATRWDPLPAEEPPAHHDHH